MSIFTKIVNQEIPSYKIAESDRYYAFLDINPLAEGHSLVIPKEEVDYIFDLKEEDFIGLHLFAKQVAKAIESVIPCNRIGIAVIGLEVPHAHIHLVPINNVGDINFSKPKLQVTDKMLKDTASRISKAFLA